MDQLPAPPAEGRIVGYVTATVEIKRAATGLVEKLELNMPVRAPVEPNPENPS